MSNDESEINKERLKKIVQEGKDVAFFIGSGPSIPVGIKKWDELLMEMAERFKCNINVKNSIRAIGYPATASEIYKQSINDDLDYLDFLHKQCESKDCDYTNIHSTIIETIKTIETLKTIITTNFDTVFEDAFADAEIKPKIQKLPEFNSFNLLKKSPTIVYIHGNSETNTYIFRKEEYDAYYPSISQQTQDISYRLERFLQEVFSHINLIFIGFSFDDYYFTEFLNKVLHEFVIAEMKTDEKILNISHSRESVEHFAIVEETQEAQLEKMRKIGLRIIMYEKGKHKQISRILKDLQKPILESKSIYEDKEIAYAR